MGKTVTTYLIDGNPNGTQYSFISNKICQMFVVPRANLSYLKDQEKLQKPAFYVLEGVDDETNLNIAYIGETENFKERVKDHDAKKQFWQKAYIFVSKDADMTKADVQYLEYRGIKEANNARSYLLKENKQNPKEPNLPEYQKDAMDEFFEDIKFLMSFSGCDIFNVIEADDKKEHIFYIKSGKCNAQGFYSSSGFVVLKNSVLSPTAVPSLPNKEKRNSWISENTIKNDNGECVLIMNKTFTSPSLAATYCTGRNSNGWTTWVDENKLTLDQVYRNQLD